MVRMIMMMMMMILILILILIITTAMITIMKKNETDGINDTDGEDKSDESPPSVLILIGSQIGLMRRGLL